MGILRAWMKNISMLVGAQAKSRGLHSPAIMRVFAQASFSQIQTRTENTLVTRSYSPPLKLPMMMGLKHYFIVQKPAVSQVTGFPVMMVKKQCYSVKSSGEGKNKWAFKNLRHHLKQATISLRVFTEGIIVKIKGTFGKYTAQVRFTWKEQSLKSMIWEKTVMWILGVDPSLIMQQRLNKSANCQCKFITRSGIRKVEYDGAMYFHVPMPGIKKDYVLFQIDGRILTVEGQAKGNPITGERKVIAEITLPVPEDGGNEYERDQYLIGWFKNEAVIKVLRYQKGYKDAPIKVKNMPQRVYFNDPDTLEEELELAEVTLPAEKKGPMQKEEEVVVVDKELCNLPDGSKIDVTLTKKEEGN